MGDHQPNSSAVSPVTAVIHSCFYPDGVSVRLNRDCSLCEWTASTGPIYMPGISKTLTLRATGATSGTGAGSFGGPSYTSEPNNTCSSRDSGWGAPLLQIGTPFSQCGSLSHDRGRLIEHILNSLLGRQGISYHDMLFICEKLYLEEGCSIPLGAVILWGGYHVSALFQKWDKNSDGALSCCLCYKCPYTFWRDRYI